jgi:hypothetical protein
MVTARSVTALLFAVSLLLGASSHPVRAQEGDIREGFDDPLLPGWEHSPDAVVSGGVLRIAPGNFALLPGDRTDPTISIRVRPAEPSELVIHYQFREQSFYALHLLEGHVVLVRHLAGTATELGGGPVSSLSPAQWADLQIALAGTEHTVWLNGEQVLVATDPEPLAPGAVLLQVHGEAAGEFDDLTVTAGAPAVGEAEPVAPVRPPAPTAPAAAAGQADGGGGLLEQFLAGQLNQIDLTTFLVNLVLAVIGAFVLGRVYVHWGTSLSNRRRFAANFMLLTITTTFIIAVVRSSVALSLGLVGALSIVRFRSAIKEPEELAYLFFAIGIGIGLGDNQRLLTLLALAATVVVLGLVGLFRQSQADVNLHLTVTSHGGSAVDLEDIMDALGPHCSKLKLLRLDENGGALEASFVVEFRRLANLTDARGALRALPGHIDVTFLDNKGVW